MRPIRSVPSRTLRRDPGALGTLVLCIFDGRLAVNSRLTSSGAGATSGRPRRPFRRAWAPTRPCAAIRGANPLLCAPLVQATKLGVDSRGAIGGPRALVDLGNQAPKLGDPSSVFGLIPALPVVEAGPGDLRGRTHPLDAVLLGVVGDEPEAGHRIVSLAK